VCAPVCMAVKFLLCMLVSFLSGVAISCLIMHCERVMHILLVVLLVVDIIARQLPPFSPSLAGECGGGDIDSPFFPCQKQKSFSSENSLTALIKENTALSITIKNLSEEHQLLCEIRNTLYRQRKDAKQMLFL